jgi:hypothetical protein
MLAQPPGPLTLTHTGSSHSCSASTVASTVPLVANASACGPHVVAPLLENRDDPIRLRHREHRAPLRCTALRRYTPADEHTATPSERGNFRVVPQIRQIQPQAPRRRNPNAYNVFNSGWNRRLRYCRSRCCNPHRWARRRSCCQTARDLAGMHLRVHHRATAGVHPTCPTAVTSMDPTDSTDTSCGRGRFDTSLRILLTTA